MIRWGILGCGDIARKRVARAIQIDENSTLVAACRRDRNELDEFCKQFQVTRAFQSPDELINCDEVDAVYVATPVYLHCENTLAVAAAGKHVIVEKPMAMCADECERMLSACEAANVKLSVAYYRRFYPAYLRIRELVKEGAIGQPLSVCATVGNSGCYADDHWRVIAEQGGGGPLMDIGSHRLDLLVDMFGEIAEVRAFCEPDGGNWNVESVASLLMRFESGVHATLQCYFGTANVPDHFSVTGTNGRIVVEPLNQGVLRVIDAEGQREEDLPPHQNLHAPLISDFTAAIKNDHQPTVTGKQGMQVTQIIDRAYQT